MTLLPLLTNFESGKVNGDEFLVDSRLSSMMLHTLTAISRLLRFNLLRAVPSSRLTRAHLPCMLTGLEFLIQKKPPRHTNEVNVVLGAPLF